MATDVEPQDGDKVESGDKEQSVSVMKVESTKTEQAQEIGPDGNEWNPELLLFLADFSKRHRNPRPTATIM